MLSMGHVLNKRYRIVSLLGQGGFGAVYRAWDMQMKAPCAVKENLDLAAESQRQFEHEARMLFNLRHSGLPKVYGSFTLPGVGQYLVMDFIEGQDLQQMLDKEGGALPLESVLEWISDVCDALTYMHSRQPSIIHRDIKPANIKITPDGEAVLVDFGIAKEFDPGQKTFTGARAYTPGYASPEQQGGKGTDALSDIYALGATTYALLTGLVPPSATDIISEITPPPELVDRVNPDVPHCVSRAIEAAMQIPRSQRTSSVGVFKGALNAVKSPPPVRLPPPAPVKKTAQAGGAPPGGKAARASTAQSRASRNWLPWVGGITAFLLLLVVGSYAIGWLFNSGGGEGDAAGTARARSGTQTAQALLVLVNDTPQPSTATQDFGAEMALVTAGSFMMGSESGGDDEEPAHEVYLNDFFIDVHEVTNANYAECVDEGDCDPPPLSSVSYSRDSYYGNPDYDDHPVIYVSWFDAQSYCEWRGARLPTEAEWEKAARGGLEDRLYPWGDESPVCRLGADNGAKFDDNAYCDDTDTENVGTYRPNGYGLYDMAGNVWEWVSDWYDKNYYEVSSSENPSGPASGEYRVVRGGSWPFYPDVLRVAYRNRGDPAGTFSRIGFRCARSP